MERKEIIDVIKRALTQLNSELPAGEQIFISEDTLLFGVGAPLDSLSLVSVIVDVEMEISDLTGKNISITDDRAMSRPVSPFDSVKTLADYIEEITNEV